MTDRPSGETEENWVGPTGLQDRVTFAVPFYEKKNTMRGISYGLVLISSERMILVPVPVTHLSGTDVRDTRHDRPRAKPEPSQTPSLTRDSRQLESLGVCADEYLDRDAGGIIHDEKNARVLVFEDVSEIIITRVRTDSRSSRWLSILFALYPLKPPGSGYSVDYELTIATPGNKYVIVTPFSLPLKQVLVDRVGDRVREIVDEYAPLL